MLSREDPDASALLAEIFETERIKVLSNCTVDKVTVSGGNKIISLDHDDKKESIEVDQILVGTGRSPNVFGLCIRSAGIEYDEKQGIKVDDMLRTTNPMIYAAGDVCMKHKFTHAADAAARIVIQNALFGGHKKLSALTIPWYTYTDPEIAHVGISEADARKQGIKIDTYKVALDNVDKALCDGEIDGFAKIHTGKGSGRILGATIVAGHAGDMISEISVAMAGGTSLGTLANVIHPYPTQSEVIKKAADKYNRIRLTPIVKGLLKKWLKWQRK